MRMISSSSLSLLVILPPLKLLYDIISVTTVATVCVCVCVKEKERERVAAACAQTHCTKPFFPFSHLQFISHLDKAFFHIQQIKITSNMHTQHTYPQCRTRTHIHISKNGTEDGIKIIKKIFSIDVYKTQRNPWEKILLRKVAAPVCVCGPMLQNFFVSKSRERGKKGYTHWWHFMTYWWHFMTYQHVPICVCAYRVYSASPCRYGQLICVQ